MTLPHEGRRPPISAIVLALNEAATIESCLRSLEGCVSEVFVVDSGSTDDTAAIARSLGARVVTHPFTGYADQRNWAQDHLPLENSWVLHVDADETIDSEFAAWVVREWKQLMSVDSAPAVLVKRRVRFLNREVRHGGTYPTFHCRLFRRDSARCESRAYDQHFVAHGHTIKAKGALIEDNGQDVIQWCRKHLRWAELEALELAGSTSASRLRSAQANARLHGRLLGNPIERRRWMRDNVYGRAPRVWRAWAYLGYRLFLRKGILDGWQGMVYHVLHGFWFRLVVDTMLLTDVRLKEGASEDQH